VYDRLQSMLKKAWKRRVSLRLVSLKLSNLYDGRFRSDLPLTVPMQRLGAQSRLAAVVDELRSSYGRSIPPPRPRFPPVESATEALATSANRLPGQPSNHSGKAGDHHLRCVTDAQAIFVSRLDPFASSHCEPGDEAWHATVALTDTGNLHGAVEFVQAARRRALNQLSGWN